MFCYIGIAHYTECPDKFHPLNPFIFVLFQIYPVFLQFFLPLLFLFLYFFFFCLPVLPCFAIITGVYPIYI